MVYHLLYLQLLHLVIVVKRLEIGLSVYCLAPLRDDEEISHNRPHSMSYLSLIFFSLISLLIFLVLRQLVYPVNRFFAEKIGTSLLLHSLCHLYRVFVIMFSLPSVLILYVLPFLHLNQNLN